MVENAVAFIKRPLLFDDNGEEIITEDIREPAAFHPGARLFIKNKAAASAKARDITSRVFSDPSFLNDDGVLLYDVKDLAVSYDGKKLLFAMRAPEIEDADEEDQPTWNIWEYDLEGEDLHRIITSDVVAEAGQDIAPAYLPDGRIVFSSTRQRTSKAILLDEGKPQFSYLDEDRDTEAFVLHVMEDDGSAIEQITFNQSHDLDPTVLDNGKIVFSRWDNAGQTRNNGINLYQVNPDGTQLEYRYGRHSHDSGDEGDRVQYLKPVEYRQDRLLVQLRTFEPQDLGALPILVDVAGFVEADRSVDGAEGEGQTPLMSGLGTSEEPSLNGRYRSAYPLFDGTNRYLVSWSPCRLQAVPDMTDPTADSVTTNCSEDRLASDAYEAADPLYGLWILNAGSGTQLPIERPQEGQVVDEAVLMSSRPLPNYIPDSQVFDDEVQSLADDGYGVLHIRSVYDFDGTDTTPNGIAAMADPVQTPPGQRPARFVRIEKPVSIPDDNVRDFDNSAFGRSAGQSMREILGYAPVEPDGSVKIAVPANVPFAISVLDDKGQRITPRHQNWMQLQRGETVECIGCHTQDSEVPHGRFDAEPPAANSGASTTGVEFPNTEPALFANMGETMAEVFARINGIRTLTADIEYEDQWTDPAATTKAPGFSYAYADLETQQPITPVCATEWTSLCRIVINYEQHIHPLWSLDRQVLDTDGVTVLADNTCTSCHTSEDDMGAARIPDAQLDLGDGPSTDDPDHLKAYRELLFNDNEQELVNGALSDVLIDTGEFERDENGELILDAQGNPIPIFETVNVSPSMSTAGAQASNDFLDRFRTGGTHAGYLSDAELKLIAEWLDLGAQYYNNPFDAPEN
ncbi:hypothetical protein QQM79_02010 [Marinobacteraceae bacterium S3BR75-40.1]